MLEPKNYPAYKEKETIDYPIDWLYGDSIESVRQNSQVINFHNTQRGRHVMEPIRMSVPSTVKGPPITQRGRCGKFADSQAFDHVNVRGHGKLVGVKNHLRQPHSLYAKERRQPQPTVAMIQSYEGVSDSMNHTIEDVSIIGQHERIRQ